MDQGRMIKKIFTSIKEIEETQAQILAKLSWVDAAQQEYKAEMQVLVEAAKAAEAEAAEFPGKAEKPKAKPKLKAAVAKK